MYGSCEERWGRWRAFQVKASACAKAQSCESAWHGRGVGRGLLQLPTGRGHKRWAGRAWTRRAARLPERQDGSCASESRNCPIIDYLLSWLAVMLSGGNRKRKGIGQESVSFHPIKRVTNSDKSKLFPSLNEGPQKFTISREIKWKLQLFFINVSIVFHFPSDLSKLTN